MHKEYKLFDHLKHTVLVALQSIPRDSNNKDVVAGHPLIPALAEGFTLAKDD